MRNKNGFTLLELLIAAAIVGGLAVMATVSYRNSVAETRIQAAKARADVLAGAVQRFRLEYPNASISSDKMTDDYASDTCSTGSLSPTSLVTCGFVDKGGWEDPFVVFYICNGKKGGCSNSSIDAPLVCMTGNNSQSKLPDKYKGKYSYCVNEFGSATTSAG